MAAIKNWKCQECGNLMTLAQAQRAANNGCAKCGSTDVDEASWEEVKSQYAQLKNESDQAEVAYFKSHPELNP